MKKVILFLALALAAACPTSAQRVTLLHTNDLHSQIDPAKQGGMARLKAAIDSVRSTDSNVLLINAGDAFQGSVFFTLFEGEVEQKLMNEMGYDILIVGNHEFDNGIGKLAEVYSSANQDIIATNYDFSATPLAGMTKPYLVKTFGDRKIGFFALNIDPKGLIDAENYQGMLWYDTLEAAQAMAWYLKLIEKVDKVVAITHIGYSDILGEEDLAVAKHSKYIDVIIGGHTHTLIDPAGEKALVKNADGKDVLVLQAENSGKWLGELVIDFDRDTTEAKLIPIDSRLDSRLDSAFIAQITPYRQHVDSLNNIIIAKNREMMPRNSTELMNLMGDIVMAEGEALIGGKVDMAISNKGGIRKDLPQGDVSQGDIMSIFPFLNHVNVIEISGADLLDNFRIMAAQKGQAVSKNVDIVYNPADTTIVSAKINGKPVDPKATYKVASIDYLINGGDYMTPLTRGTLLKKSKDLIYQAVIRHLEKEYKKGKYVNVDKKVRMRPL